MPPKRQPAKRKAAQDPDVDLSDNPSTTANKKAKRSQAKPATRKSPRAQSRGEPMRSKASGKAQKGLSDEDDDGEETESQETSGRGRLEYVAMQHRSSQNEVRKSKQFISDFRKKQDDEREELSEYIRDKINDMNAVTKAFPQKFTARYSELSKGLGWPASTKATAESHSLYNEGRDVIAICQEVLLHYSKNNEMSQAASTSLPIPSRDRDRSEMLEIISKGKHLGEKIISSSVSPAAGRGALVVPKPVTSVDKVVAAFFEKSLASLAEKPWGKGAWGMWVAWDKVLKGSLGEDELYVPTKAMTTKSAS